MPSDKKTKPTTSRGINDLLSDFVAVISNKVILSIGYHDHSDYLNQTTSKRQRNNYQHDSNQQLNAFECNFFKESFAKICP